MTAGAGVLGAAGGGVDVGGPLTAVLAQAVDLEWIARNGDDVWRAVVEHVQLTVIPVAAGFAIAFPLALVSLRYPRLYGPLLGATGVLFTIPSLALFVGLIPFVGLGAPPVLLALTIYTLLILLRNTVEGLRGVPPDVTDAAEAMGYGRLRRLLRVEVPLALPVVFAGLRIATVSTIALVPVGAYVGAGGLGVLIFDGLRRFFATPLLVGFLGAVVLAVAADLILLGVERAVTPWRR